MSASAHASKIAEGFLVLRRAPLPEGGERIVQRRAMALRGRRLRYESLSIGDRVSKFIARPDPKRIPNDLGNGRLTLAGEFAGDRAAPGR
jgi:hypothetical protein